VIYIAITARNDAATVGLVLWKVRLVFADFPRDYHVLVAEDGSTDDTAQTLETYQGVVPMSVIRHDRPRGFARSIEELFQHALARSDRPRRDCIVTLPPDFAVSPSVVPEFVKRFESGADLVVGEMLAAREPFRIRLVRRLARFLLRPGLSVPGVRDLTSGVYAIRLITLRNCFRDRPRRLLETDGWCANAELVGRTAARARQIATLPLPPQERPPEQTERLGAVSLALGLLRAGRRLSIPAPAVPVRRS
jgi:glycosyltransferase involved in cell wall biosynthesis